jgi:tetratricopeptide (TPR) repeat protein
VSIRQLQHKVAPEALKEYEKGQKAARKGDHALALDYFRKAVDADPEFADAFNNLGAAESALGRLEDAAQEFQKAVDLVPDHSQAIANLSIVLCKLKRYDEAGEAARKALRLDPRLSNVRYILAVTLSMKQGHENEALENLERVGPDLPKAHLLAADILTKTGRLDEAARQLEQYLRVAPQQDTDRPNVQEWLSALRRP